MWNQKNITGLLIGLTLVCAITGIAAAENGESYSADFLLTAAFALFSGVIYCAMNYLTSTKEGGFDLGRLIASCLFGLFLGGVVIYQGTPVQEINWTLLGTLFFTFQGMLMWLNAIVDKIWRAAFKKAVLEGRFGTL